MPVVAVDGLQYNNLPSTYFYLTYYAGAPGAASGNCLFKMAWVASATSASAWLPPKGSDSLIIGNLKSFSVDVANRGGISMTSLNDAPAIVWWHEYSATDHDIYFAKTVNPAHDNASESSVDGKRIFLRNPVNRGRLLFSFPDDMAGAELSIYSPDGREVARVPLAREIEVNLPSGSYIWQVGGFTGRAVIE